MERNHLEEIIFPEINVSVWSLAYQRNYIYFLQLLKSSNKYSKTETEYYYWWYYFTWLFYFVKNKDVVM